MKAMAAFSSRRELGIVEHPEPVLSRPCQVKLQILEAGICGTDREIATFAYGEPPEGSQYLVMGHEALGLVVEVGDAVRDVAPGDLAVLTVRRPCSHSHCEPCRQDHQDFCATGDFTERGIKGRHGFMAQYVVDDARHMVRVPPELRDVAVLTEPLTVAEKALEQARLAMKRIPSGGNGGSAPRPAVVLGAGPIGLLGAMKLLDSGHETWIYSRCQAQSHNARVMEALGVRFVDADQHSPEDLAALVGDIGLIYEAAGAAELSFAMLCKLGINGVFVFTGIPAIKAPVSVDAQRIMRQMVLQNQAVIGSVNAGREAYAQALVDMVSFKKRFPEALAGMITDRIPLDTVPEALAACGGIKTVVEIS